MRKKEFTGLFSIDAQTLNSMTLEELKKLGSMLPDMPDDVKAMYSEKLEAYENALRLKEQSASTEA